MAHPLKHAESSARKFGGKASDYIALHTWFDASKAHMSDFRHRALKHHSQGIFWAEEVFGVALTNSDGGVGDLLGGRRDEPVPQTAPLRMVLQQFNEVDQTLQAGALG